MAEPMPRSGEPVRRRLFDALDEGVVVQDADGSVRDANAVASRMLGLTLEQMCGRAPVDSGWDVCWENGAALRSVDRPLRTVLQTALERGRITIAVQKPGGATAWLAISAHRVYADGAHETIVATLTDVTAQREMEVENAHYREIIDTLSASHRILEESPIGTCSVDAAGKVLRGNMAFLALGGVDSTSIVELLPDEDRAAMREALARLSGGEVPSARLETRIRRPTGVATWCEITAVAMRQRMPDAAILLLINDVTDRRRREERLRQLAERDPLTGLHNRRSFVHVLRERLSTLERGRRRDVDWTLMLIDLDGFKEVNDTCGHAGGDAVLVAVAAGIRDRTRVDDTVARLGGDEFAVLFQSRAASDAAAIGQEIIERISRVAGSVEGAPPVTASIGIVHLRAGRGADATLAAADAAMYDAKRAGKARCVDAGVAFSGR